MTGFEAILAAAGAASGIISALAVMVISGGSPRLVVWAAAAVWAATAAVIILDLNALQTALAITAACAPLAAAAGRASAGRAERKNAEEARRALAKLLPQGWNPDASPRGAGPEAGPEGSPDDVNIIIDPHNHPADRVSTAMTNCLAGRRGDTARVIAENLAANLQARIDRSQRKTGEAKGGARDEAMEKNSRTAP